MPNDIHWKRSFFKPFTVIVFMTLVLFTFSCKKKGPEHMLFGNWYGFESDSTYYELYINDTLIVLNHHLVGPIGYDYELLDGMLLVSNAAGMERVWRMVDLEEDFFSIEDSLQSITYFRLTLDHDFFQSIKDSISYVQFKDAFAQRLGPHLREED